MYLEITIFKYYFDKERDGHSDTVKLFGAIRNKEYEAYTSGYTVIELEDAHEPKRARFRNDSAHIAIASVHGLDCILSYNFSTLTS